MMHRLRQSIVVLSLTALGACSSPSKPTPPTPDAPTLSCPASVSLVSPDGARVPFLFPLPTPVNGQPPVTVSCSGVQAAGYSAGSSVITCTATDALSRQGSCSFTVTVTVTPKISKTKFLAFGDSITNGRCGPAPGECPKYAERVDELLRARYTAQTFSVVSRGVNGERIEQGEDRLPSELAAVNPEVLMLMEGTNNITTGNPDFTEPLDSLEDMIDLARARGVTAIFLATIPPIAPGGPNNSVIPLVEPFNFEIRNLALRKGVTLVDVYSALKADVPRYYVGNDLHPTAEGLRLIGETFYERIRATLDITPVENLLGRR